MKRDLAIDLLKFLAVLCVVNSHMDVCYPGEFRFLATGGAIGDALFFFCSGYTLFIGQDDNFSSWYKRRLYRILPSVLVCVLAYSTLYGEGWYVAVSGYWFVRCILLYYLILFFVRKYLRDRLWLPFGVLIIASCGCWLLVNDPKRSIYSGGLFMWTFYIFPMLAGGIVGLKRFQMRYSGLYDAGLFVVSIALFFVTWRCGMNYDGLEWMQLLSVVFLTTTIVALYRLSNMNICKRLMASNYAGTGVVAVGGLCLEVYLSHRILLVDRFNNLFPFNILGIFVGIILLAYIVRVISRFLVQTINGSREYVWREIFKV